MKHGQKIYQITASVIIILLTVIFCWAGSIAPFVEISSPTYNQKFRSSIQQLTVQGWNYTTDAAGYDEGLTEYWVDTDGDGTADEHGGEWQSVSSYTKERSSLNAASVSTGTMDTRKILRQPISESVYRSGSYIIKMTGIGLNAMETSDTAIIQIRKARRPTWE